MEYMLIILEDRDAPPDDAVMAEMGRFAGELAAQGRIRGGSPLHPEAEGFRIRPGRDGPLVTDGPFVETKEVIGGYFLIDCDSREEALAIARRCPHTSRGTLEVRQVVPMGPPPTG
ncbi:MAG: YciI family protein [Myxococcota bacterium]